jgi:predicted RNA binding protein with dsRBD fold (UPF0201 family)
LAAEEPSVQVCVEARVYVTEDEQKVREALTKFIELDTVEYFKGDDYGSLRGKGSGKQCLMPLRNALRRQRTLDVARSYITRSLTPVGFNFEINKQAAYAGSVVFCSDPSESPLGPISIRVGTSAPQMLLDWLATPTIDGVPIDELRQRNFKRQTVKGRRNTRESFDDMF